jgi:hypothetical protein
MPFDFDITQFFKPQSSDKSQETNTAQENLEGLSPFEQEQLRIQREHLELQKQEASMNPDFQLERDAERLLNPETILSKKGMPVIQDKDTGLSFVPSEVVDFVTDSRIKKPMQELEQRAKTAEEQLNKLQDEAYRNPKVAEYLNKTYPALSESMNVEVNELIPYLQLPAVQQFFNLNREEEAIATAIQLMNQQAEIDKKLGRAEFLSKKQTYSDGSEVPSSVANKLYDQYQEAQDNPYKQFLGKQIIFEVPDNAKQGDASYTQAMLYAGKIGAGVQGLTENNPRLHPIVRVVKQSEVKSMIDELQAHPTFKKDEYGNPTSLIVDKRFLQSA